MKTYKLKYYFFLIACAVTFCSCKKYLAAKPDDSLALPETLNDLQLLLNNYSVMNAFYPSMSEIASDNFYLTDAGWSSAAAADQHYYLWQTYDNNAVDWVNTNKIITTANLILESLAKIHLSSQSEEKEANDIKGSALFFRAYSNWIMAQSFCKGYNKNTAGTDLGLPIRLNSNVTEKYKRSTVEQTYQQILSDLMGALPLLPDTADVKYHVSKAATFGMLSRSYMAMQDYEKAGIYADSCLFIYNLLMDYNNDANINPSSTTAPFARWNKEVIFDASSLPATSLARTRAIIDTTLYAMYQNNDLRKNLFFQKNTSNAGYNFKGNYTGLTTAALFLGIATDEMLLNRAECYARTGNTDLALQDINTLLSKRWITGMFKPVNVANHDSLINTILEERRKELVFRGLRWTDLRRLNEETKYQTTLKRAINGTGYTLLPNSDRYTFLLPQQAIDIGGLQQNP